MQAVLLMETKVVLKPTIAWARGDTAVFQHSYCGTLVAVRTTNRDRRKPAEGLVGPCPWTGCAEPDFAWWAQPIEVGPYTEARVVQWCITHESFAVNFNDDGTGGTCWAWELAYGDSPPMPEGFGECEFMQGVVI